MTTPMTTPTTNHDHIGSFWHSQMSQKSHDIKQVPSSDLLNLRMRKIDVQIDVIEQHDIMYLLLLEFYQVCQVLTYFIFIG